MNFSIVTGDPARTRSDALVLFAFAGEVSDKKKRALALTSADAKSRGALLKTAASEGFSGKAEQLFSFNASGRLATSRVILAGLGTRAQFSTEVLRLAAGRAIKAAGRVRARNVAIALPDIQEGAAVTRAVVEGAALGAYRYDKWRTTNKDEKSAARVDRVLLVLPASQKKSRELDGAVDLGKRVAQATNWARDLVNEPPATMTPSVLAAAAVEMAKEAGLNIAVHDRKTIEKLKMGMFLGVTQGSVEEPKLVHVSYIPRDAEAQKRPAVALVGKAITFDSGGLSLKTAEGMVDMKTDMAGSAAVLGAMRVVAALKPPFPVHGFLGACENMPSGTAYRPGDVLVSRLGKTVEITNTDAEGRLVLGDVLAWANETKPACIIDLATLTGACMVALGHYIAGAFGDDDQLMWSVLEAGRSAGEELWRLPVTELQRDDLKSDIADMKNSGGRYGGASNAALFLKEFVGHTPWVHLDIAGPSQSPKDRGYHSKGATGIGVRTLVEFVRRRGLEVTAQQAASTKA